MVEYSRNDSSMNRLVNDNSATDITTSMNINNDPTMSGTADDFNPLKLRKSAMPKKGSAHTHKPNRRGKLSLAVPIRLHISGRNLKNLDVFSKSDPLCIVLEKAQDTDEWFEVGRTEYIKNTLNPDFQTCIDIDFYFEKTQILKFEFIDDDGGDEDDPYYDVIGSTTTNLSTVMASKGHTLSKPLTVPGRRTQQRGMVIVRMEAVKESNH